ncbi:hypothetical protein MMC25_000433 [Agyrium rufum]|nr:hypothetical protein [Agyrium rufum]
MYIPYLLTTLHALSIPSLHPHHSPHDLFSRSLPTTLTTSQILSIAPSSSTCANSPAANQCLDASSIAALPLTAIASYYTLSITGELAAALGTVAFESGEFKYNHNVFPGRPGQGTRNMQMPNYNLQYATSLAGMDAGFAGKLKVITTATDASGLSDQTLDALLDLIVSYPMADFGSAFWFIGTVCQGVQGVREGLRAGTLEGWSAYITGCLGTTVTDERQAYWEKACAALGGC